MVWDDISDSELSFFSVFSDITPARFLVIVDELLDMERLFPVFYDDSFIKTSDFLTFKNRLELLFPSNAFCKKDDARSISV